MKNYKILTVIAIICISLLSNISISQANPFSSIWNQINNILNTTPGKIANFTSSAAASGCSAAIGLDSTGAGEAMGPVSWVAQLGMCAYNLDQITNILYSLCPRGMNCTGVDNTDYNAIFAKQCAADPTLPNSNCPGVPSNPQTEAQAPPYKPEAKQACQGPDGSTNNATGMSYNGSSTGVACYCPNNHDKVIYPGSPIECNNGPPKNSDQALINAQRNNQLLSSQQPPAPTVACVVDSSGDGGKAPQGGCYCPADHHPIPEGVYVSCYTH